MTPARKELRDLIAAKIDEKMRSERLDDNFDGQDYAEAVLALFHDVADDWDSIDVSTLGDVPGSQTLEQRWLVARIPRESRERNLTPDRNVE